MRKILVIVAVLFYGIFLFSTLSQAAPLDWDNIDIDYGDDCSRSLNSFSVFKNEIYMSASCDSSEIWRSSNGNNWTATVEDGFGDTYNEFDQMIVFGDYLYLEVYNRETGVEVWRTNNGTDWRQVNDSGFGNVDMAGIDSIVVFNGYLYIGTQGNVSTDPEIWRTRNGTTWSRVDTGELGSWSIYSMATFNDRLFAGTVHGVADIILWYTNSGTEWTSINMSETFGERSSEDSNINKSSMVVFKDNLYLGTENFLGTEIWRTNNGANWSEVDTDGFGDVNNYRIDHMIVFNDYLYATTQNTSTGIEIWRTSNGTDWSQANSDGFGRYNPMYTANIESAVVYNDCLYMGTNDSPDTEGALADVWRTGSGCDSSGDSDTSTSSDYDEVVSREQSAYTGKDEALVDRLSGRILLQTEENGEAWYVNPTNEKKYYLGRPADAFRIMRNTGLGVTNENLNKVPTDGTDWTINQDFKKYVIGRILIQVEKNGEAWYVSPVNEKKYYMGRPADAFQLMRNLGLGISSTDLRKIEVGE